MLDVQVNSKLSADHAGLNGSGLGNPRLELTPRYDNNSLATLLGLGQTWVWETDSQHRFSFISKAMETATGLLVKDSIGKTRRECFFGKAGLTPAMVAHLDDLENHRPFNDFVFRSSGKTEKKLWVSISGTPRFDKAGEFLGYIGISRGLSDQAFADSGLKNAADQLSRVETLMADIIGSVPDGIALWDSNCALVMCNQNFREMVAIDVPFEAGETYETIIRRVMDDNQILNYGGTKEEWLQTDMRIMREAPSIEDLYLLPNGRWILRRVKRSPNGECVDIRTDITELKHKEESLKAALEDAVLAQTVINNLSEPVFVKDSNLNFVFCNDAFAAIVNKKAKDLPGKRAYDFVTALEAKAFEESEREILASGATNTIEEDHFEGGIQKTRLLRKSRITTSSGKQYVAGFMFDITPLRQRESAMAAASRRAESADKAKSDFLAQMSHEIRTPMNGVLSMTELLGQSTLDERQRVFVDIIRKSGESLLATINSILDFTRIESGAMTLESAPFQLRSAVEDIAEILVAEAIEKETDIIIDIEPGLPATVTGDEGRFRQIVSNLLSNAIKFTENGQIKVSLTGRPLEDGKLNLALTVSDTGMGIPADKLDQIFDRFAQINNPDISKPDGTGLGLSIVAKLAKMMGGLCRVQSALGKGSTFYVDMPIDCPDARAPSTPVSDAMRAKRVLIVDANPDWRASLLRPLKHWGFDVAAVESPQTALALANVLNTSGKTVDLVLIGCNEPEMNCIEIGHMIDRKWPGLPPRKLLIAPINAVVSPQVLAGLNTHAMLSLPLKQACLYHQIVDALQATIEPNQFQPAEPETLTAKAKKGGISRVDVLIAEDNPVNQLVVTQILSNSGLAYQIVANGELAVEAFEEMQPRLILMDIGMPKLNGFEATKAIRALRHLGGDTIPIVAVTGGAAGETRENCLKAGMNDHLAKPISPEALLAKITQWLPKLQSKSA